MIDYTLTIINNVNSLIELNFIFAFFLYFILTTIFFTLSLPGGLVVMISSGFLFGFYYGFIINIVSIVIGSYIFFIFTKYFFTNYFNKYLINYNNKINVIIKNSSFEYLIILRLIFGIPLFVQNIFLSSLNISRSKFLITTIIGFTPYHIIFSYLGSQFSNILDVKNFNLTDILSFELFFLIFALFFILIIIIILKNYQKHD